MPVHADAMIDGVENLGAAPAFSLTAKAGHISTGDGGSVHIWGYAHGGGKVQYPGPTIIVQQGAVVTVDLKNSLAVPVSIVFPGHRVTATGGEQGPLTREAAPGGSVSYRFTATAPGTYIYHSGTRPDIQVEMGLVGAIIVRPTGFDPASPTAYGNAGSAYDHEYLFLLSEVSGIFDKNGELVNIHELVEFGLMDQVDTAAYVPVYWFINGRNAPDTMAPAGAPWLPTQPYDCMPRMHPGEKLLLRVVSAGRDLHPFHTHGNNFWVIARDGRLLESVPGKGGANYPDLSESNFTLQAVPGETADAIFEWTGYKLGWDIYGPLDPACTDADNDGFNDAVPALLCHDAACTDGNGDGFDDATHEYCADHGKPLPVALPDQKDLSIGSFWSGSPFLGAMGALPPGKGGLNMNGGLIYMWHSHAEKEMTNFDIFPGGMMTMLIIEPPGTPIP